MKSAEVRAHLDALALTAIDAARLLGVGLRSVRRWTQLEPELPAGQGAGVAAAAPRPGAQAVVDLKADDAAIPGPAAQALRAWLKLHRLGLHWRPDGVPLGDVDPVAALARVRERGGVRKHWDVDLRRCVASLAGHRVSFGWPRRWGSALDAAPGAGASTAASSVVGWSLQSYSREPGERGDRGGPGNGLAAVAEAAADEACRALVDDACASIARRLAGERVPPWPTLVLGDPVLIGEKGERDERDEKGDLVELRDVSFNPIVVCRLRQAALAAFLELPALETLAPAQLLAFARRHHAALAALATELHARRPLQPSPLGQRLLDIGAGDLGLVRRQLASAAPGAAQGVVAGRGVEVSAPPAGSPAGPPARQSVRARVGASAADAGAASGGAA